MELAVSINVKAEDFMACDVLAIRGNALWPSRGIQDTCDCWSSHNAPVYRRDTGELAVLDIVAPKALTTPLAEYLSNLRVQKLRYAVFRHFAVGHGTHLEPETIEWQRNASRYWQSLEGTAYSWSEIFRIGARHWIDNSIMPDGLKRLLRPRKGMLFCTRGTIEGLAAKPFGPENGPPPELFVKGFANPGDFERSVLMGTRYLHVGGSDPDVMKDIRKVFEES